MLKIYVDRVESGRNVYDAGVGATLYVAIGKRLTRPPYGDPQFMVPPVYPEVPSKTEVRALAERFRMVTGALPTSIIIPKIVVRSGRREVVVGYNVLLRGAA